jgi:hypothetical protein
MVETPTRKSVRLGIATVQRDMLRYRESLKAAHRLAQQLPGDQGFKLSMHVALAMGLVGPGTVGAILRELEALLGEPA